eukprot:4195251-Alexandrium_andersonii.AAC.1
MSASATYSDKRATGAANAFSGLQRLAVRPPRGGHCPLGPLRKALPVSYTHLTLPTICSV